MSMRGRKAGSNEPGSLTVRTFHKGSVALPVSRGHPKTLKHKVYVPTLTPHPPSCTVMIPGLE